MGSNRGLARSRIIGLGSGVVPRRRVAPVAVRSNLALGAALGDGPLGGATRRAVCTAFLLAASCGQIHWRPADLDLLIFQGIEIHKRHPELAGLESPTRFQTRFRTHQTLHILSLKKRASSVSRKTVGRTLTRFCRSHAPCLLEWGQHAAALVRRTGIVGEQFLVFNPGNAEDDPAEIIHTDTLMSLTSLLPLGDDVRVSGLSITRQLQESPATDLPDLEEICQKVCAAYRSSSVISDPLHLSLKNGTTNTSLTVPGFVPSVTPSLTRIRDSSFRWLSLSGLTESMAGLVTCYRQRLEGRASLSLTAQIAELEAGTFSYRDPDTVALQDALRVYITDLCAAMAEDDPLWRGATVHFVGSYYDGTRVSASADEFDILVSVSLRGVTVGRGWSWWLGRPGWQVSVFGEALAACRGHGGRKGVLRRETVWFWPHHVDPEAFHARWRHGVTAKMATVRLPEGLTHGGPLAPSFSGVGVSPTAMTLQLVWRGATRVSLDLTPAFPVPRESLWKSSLQMIDRLLRVAGVSKPPLTPAHLIPLVGRDHGKWVVTTAVVEMHALDAMGPLSRPVARIRGLKLLARRYLQWCPLEREVTQAGETLQRLSREEDGSEEVLSWDVPLGDLARYVTQSLRDKRLQLPCRQRQEAEGKPRQSVYYSRVAMVVAATHRAHCGGDGRCPGPCGLCDDLAREAAFLVRYPGLVHPAVREVVGAPLKPWMEIRSAYIKYQVFENLLRGVSRTLPTDLPGYLERMERDLRERSLGGSVPHPLLGRPVLHAMVGRCVLAAVSLATARCLDPHWPGPVMHHCWPAPRVRLSGEDVDRIVPVSPWLQEMDVPPTTRPWRFPLWMRPPRGVIDSHTEVCRELSLVPLTDQLP